MSTEVLLGRLTSHPKNFHRESCPDYVDPCLAATVAKDGTFPSISRVTLFDNLIIYMERDIFFSFS